MSKVLTFDAGHYGKYNRGTTVKEYYESEFTWKIVNKTKKYLEKNYDVKIRLTRKKQAVDRALYSRGYAAKGTDGFYSFHSNACGTEKVDRVVVIYGINANSERKKFALDLANAIKKCITCIDDKSQVYSRKGKNGEYYGVLRGAAAAGVKDRYIIEHGFYTNTATAKWHLVDSNLNKLAKADGDAIAKHHGLKKKASTNPTVKKNETKTETKKDSKSFKVKVTVDELNIRKKADVTSAKVGSVKKGDVYTIVEESGSWGKLKSGAGWINVSSKYVKRV